MNKKERLAIGDKVEIIDRAHPHFGKKGIVLEIKHQARTILNNPKESGTTTIVKVKLEDSDILLFFESHPKPLKSQIRKL